jgi:hypothetical protein
MAERQVWKKRVEQWKRSGMTSAEFAARNGGFNPATLKYWKWELGREARRAKAPEKRARQVEFLELVQSSATSPASRPEPDFVLELDGGPYRIRVSPAFDVDGLRRLLSVLERRS